MYYGTEIENRVTVRYGDIQHQDALGDDGLLGIAIILELFFC